jgi:hypothetical protein
MATSQAPIERVHPDIFALLKRFLPPESFCALSLVSKTVASKMPASSRHVQSGTMDRGNLLSLLERDVNLQVFCYFCGVLHLPENCLPYMYPGQNRGCQGAWTPRPYLFPNFPREFHPTLLRGIVKYRSKGIETAPLEARLVIDRSYNAPRGVFDGYRWRACVNEHGVFIIQELTHLVMSGGDRVPLRICNHCTVFTWMTSGILRETITCGDVMHDGELCNQGLNQTHGCKRCNRDFRCVVECPSSQDRTETPGLLATVVVTTWISLGAGDSTLDIAHYLRAPHDMLVPSLGIGRVEVFSAGVW